VAYFPGVEAKRRKLADRRNTINGILRRLRAGAPWHDVQDAAVERDRAVAPVTLRGSQLCLASFLC
jgi:hypothetical protein